MRTKLSLIILFLILICQLAGIVVLAKLIAVKANLLFEQKHKLIALQKRNESLNKLQKDYQRIKNDIGLLNLVLPNKKGIVGFLDTIESEASSSGIKATISFSNKSIGAESETIKYLKLSLKIKGTYNQIIEFIKKIENLPQIVVVEKINIQSPNGIEKENNAVINIKSYIDPKF